MAGACQHAQHTMLVWEKHCRGLNIHQPSHFANDLSDDSVRFKRPNHGVRRFKQSAQFAKFFQPVELQTDERTCQIPNLVIACSEDVRMYWDGLLRSRQCLMLDGERVERSDDPDQQHEPEQQATDGEEQCGSQQPDMELSDDGLGLGCRSLHDDGPASIRDRNGTEKPVLATGPWTQA